MVLGAVSCGLPAGPWSWSQSHSCVPSTPDSGHFLGPAGAGEVGGWETENTQAAPNTRYFPQLHPLSPQVVPGPALTSRDVRRWVEGPGVSVGGSPTFLCTSV